MGKVPMPYQKKISFKDMRPMGEQRKILIISVLVVLAFLVFVRLIYVPQKKRFEVLKKELQTMEAEIREIKKNVGVTGDESMVRSLDVLLKRFKSLDEKFPSKEEALLRALPSYAQRYGIEIRSMQPQKKRAASAIDGVEVAIAGYRVMEIQISIAAAGTYKSVGEYARALKEEFPALIKVNSLELSSPAPGRGKEAQKILNINMSITAYLLTPSSKET
jgi:hypothetical protein